MIMHMSKFGEAKIPAFGIDLGTTNSCIAVIGNGNQPEVIKIAGKNTMPSCVMWEGGDSFIVGTEAYLRRGEANVVYSVKRLMGGGKKVNLKYNGISKDFEPWEISREILKSLVFEAKKGLYRNIEDVVITVPAYFTNTQIEETKKAGEAAGLNIINMMKEPTAAALIYNRDISTINKTDLKQNCYSGSDTAKKVLLYDLGGGTFDVSVVKVSKQDSAELDNVYGLDNSGKESILFSVVKVLGDMKLGGDDIDKILVDSIVSRLIKQGIPRNDIDETTRKKIFHIAEQWKKQGISSYRSTISLKGQKVELSLNPSDFEKAYKAIYQKTKQIMDKVLEDPSTGGRIDQIITVGGSTKAVLIQSNLKNDFPNIPINSSLNPDESVALGAAIQAKRSKFGDDSINILECLAMNIGLLSNGQISNVLKAGDQIPCSNFRTFLTMEEGQLGVDLDVYQGLTRYPEECTCLGRLKLDNLETRKDVHGKILLTLFVDSNGLLSIEAEAGASGIHKLELVNLSDSTTSNHTRASTEVVRWRRFISKLSEEQKKIGLDLLKNYEKGKINKDDVVAFMSKNKKPIEHITS